jgi:orotidine-5'-phosphate decarboxylase
MAELVVALDLPDAPAALDMAARLAGAVTWVKVGLELYTAQGPAVLTALKGMGFKVFLDLKFLDIPNTVRGAVRSAVGAGADMLNVHASGGARMMQAARQGLDEAAAPGAAPLLLAVTVLTSMDERDLPLGPGRTVADLVLDLARATREAAGARRGLLGARGPGGEGRLRTGLPLPDPRHPPRRADDDQRRVMTPAMAVAAGADFLVAGRPVTQLRTRKPPPFLFLNKCVNRRKVGP